MESIDLRTFDDMLDGHTTFERLVTDIRTDLTVARAAIDGYATGPLGVISDALVDVDEVADTVASNRRWAVAIRRAVAPFGGRATPVVAFAEGHVNRALLAAGERSFDSDGDRRVRPDFRTSGLDYAYRQRAESLAAVADELATIGNPDGEIVALRTEIVERLAVLDLIADHEREHGPSSEEEILEHFATVIADLEAERGRTDGGPPSGLEELGRQRATNAAQDVVDWLSIDLDRRDALLGIGLAHARTLITVAAMDEHGPYRSAAGGESIGGINATNTSYFDTQVALGTVYLHPDNRASVEATAATYGLHPALLHGVVAAELDFDYEAKNRLRDLSDLERAPLDPFPDDRLRWILDESQGPANVHRETLELAIDYLTDNELPGADAAAAYPIDNDQYRTSLEGSIEGAAIVTAMYDDLFGGSATAEERAVVWSAYRGGVQGELNRANDTAGGNFESVEEYRALRGNAAPTEFLAGPDAVMSTAMFTFLTEQYDGYRGSDAYHWPDVTPPAPDQGGPPAAGTTTTTVPAPSTSADRPSPTIPP